MGTTASILEEKDKLETVSVSRISEKLNNQRINNGKK